MPHPSAARPILSLPHKPISYSPFSVSVNRDLIAVLAHDEYWDDEQELWIYNWKTGQLYLVSEVVY